MSGNLGNFGGGMPPSRDDEFMKNFALVEDGMSKREVIDLMGAPEDVTNSYTFLFADKIEIWIYSYKGKKYFIEFLKGKVRKKRKEGSF